VRVRRDGLIGDLPATVLVPGDVIALAEGDQVPADCRPIEAFDMRIDNATLTGESVPRGRDTRPDPEPTHDTRAQQTNMVLAGTSVAAGEGLAVVVATGMRTEFGCIAHLTQMAPERTAPLQREIAGLSRLIALLSVLLGAALFFIGRAVHLPFWDNFVFAIGVIVANVPEGLLPTLTLSMAMGAQRMAARRTASEVRAHLATVAGSVRTPWPEALWHPSCYVACIALASSRGDSRCRTPCHRLTSPLQTGSK
jgi:magnesium-transporting ATPase (P-type)